VPLEEALGIAKQIADALEAAHEKGITHRDLKPANIKLRPDGTVKVLDFGLAKMAEPAEAGARTENSPTLTLDAATRLGVILGTAAYMSPEQARGKPVDKRADIWSFGVVLYEMLTAKRLFRGESVSDTLAALLKEEPPWDTVPAKVRPLLQSCLEKDSKRRLRDIGDAWRLLDEASPTTAVRPSWLAWGLTALLFLIMVPIVFLYLRGRAPAPEPSSLRYQIFAPDQKLVNSGALSPDGHKLALVTTDGTSSYLWLRSLDKLDSRYVADIGSGGGGPFWSPDSLYVAIGSGKKLKKFDVSGGPGEDICDLPVRNIGGAWSKEHVIVIGSTSGLWKVSEDGGVPAALTSVDASQQEVVHGYPSFLTDGRHFIYLRAFSQRNRSGTYIGSIDDTPSTPTPKRLFANPAPAVYSPAVGSTSNPGGGYLVFSDTRLMAWPFDSSTLQLTGPEIALDELFARTSVSVSNTGTLMYVGGSQMLSRLTWFDRDGRSIGPVTDPGVYSEVALSPDGKSVAMDSGDLGRTDVSVLDFGRSVTTRLTHDGAGRAAVWSADGKQIVYSDNSGNLFLTAASGAAALQMLYKSDEPKTPNDWSRDGRFLLFTSTNSKTANDLWVMPMTGERTPTLFVQTVGQDGLGSFSPDGRFVLYLSNESGQNEIYVKSFPDAERRWQISKGGGVDPRWRHDGREILYMSGSKLMGVEVTTSPSFQLGAPTPLFEAPFVQAGNWARNNAYDVTADGKKILATIPLGQTPAGPLTIVLNWQAGLKK
jgi:Tol biopolymer transport system component